MEKSIKYTIISILAILAVFLIVSCATVGADKTSASKDEPYSISKIYRSGSYTVYEVAPREDGQYNIYGYLRVPDNVRLKHLIVKVQKIGIEQPYEDTTKQVREESKRGSNISDVLNAITLFVSLPETKMSDGQRHLELDTGSLLESGKFGHIDRQVCNLIDDVELFVKNEFEIELPKKVDMFGYSGEGDFIVRFALLHPQYLHAVCAGGTSWSPSVALETLNGEALKYPLGLSGIELYSEDFNLEEWKSIHFFIDIGIHDDRGSYNRKQLKSMEWSKNLSFQQVYDVFCNAFVNLTDNAEMVLYYSLGHEYNSNDYVRFLKLNDGDEFVPIETSTSARVITSSGVFGYQREDPKELYLVIDGIVIKDGSGFGKGDKQFTVQVNYGSDAITDYSFELADPSYGEVYKDSDGVLHLHTTHPNSKGTALTIWFEDSMINCNWFDPHWHD